MSDAKPKPFLTIELRCGCGATLFAECPQEPTGFAHELPKSLIQLATAFTNAHAAHHQEPKKPLGSAS